MYLVMDGDEQSKLVAAYRTMTRLEGVVERERKKSGWLERLAAKFGKKGK